MSETATGGGTGAASGAAIGYQYGGGYGALIGAILGGAYGAIAGGQAHHRQHAIASKYRRIALQQQEAANRAMQERIARLNTMQQEEEGRRATSISTLDAAYANPSREAGYQQQYNTGLNSAYANLGQQYKEGSRQNRIQQAQRGTMGGSTDIEHQTNLGAAYQGGVGDAVGQGLRQVRSSRYGDQSQFQSLKRGLLSGDPGMEAQYASQANTDQAEIDRRARMRDFAQNGARLRGQGADDFSRYIGNTGYALAGSFDNGRS